MLKLEALLNTFYYLNFTYFNQLYNLKSVEENSFNDNDKNNNNNNKLFTLNDNDLIAVIKSERQGLVDEEISGNFYAFIYRCVLRNFKQTTVKMEELIKLFNRLIVQYELIYIPETYLIAIVLGFITFILGCLVRRKHRNSLIESKANASASMKAMLGSSAQKTNNANVGGGKSTAALNRKQQQQQKHVNEDEGHLSDSAISFIPFVRSSSGPRFRKRDKLAFYGKKMLRNFRGSISARSAEKSRDIYRIISKKILNKKPDDPTQPLYRRTEPPQFLLDIETSTEKMDHNLPSALINLIRSVKVFGYFDQKIILEMCKYMETKTVYANNYLFKIGEPDDSIYVVESGRVHVYITDEKGRKHLIKECTEGNHIFSLLSIMDVLTGDLKPYRTVSAKAIENTSILRLPGKAFVDVLKNYPDFLVRITQIIIVRLQRVTFTALHNYLGLTSEIIRSSDAKKIKKSRSRSDFSGSLHNNGNHASSNVSVERRSRQSSLSTNDKHVIVDGSGGGGESAPTTAAKPTERGHHHHHHYHHHGALSSSKAHNQNHHHHHHHHHYHHGAKLAGNEHHELSQVTSCDSLPSNEEDIQRYYHRKNSVPLPPVGFFVQEYDSESNKQLKKKISLDAIKLDDKSSEKLTTTAAADVSSVLGDHTLNENDSSCTDNHKDYHHSHPSEIPKTHRANLRRNSYSSSSETMETASSSYESNSNGSEFGDFDNQKELYNKLPQIKQEMARILNLKSPDFLDDKVDLTRVSEGTVLCKEGDYNCSLIFVLDGLLFATQKELNGEESVIFYCNPNQFCGNLSVISGEPSLFTIKAKCYTELAIITKENFYKLVAADPNVVLSVAHINVKRMSPFVRQIDFALEWNLIESGSVLFRQGVKAENIYIVLNGRLRSILKVDENNKQLVGEYGRGDLVGLVEILMETNNATTVVAIRDTEVAQIPSGLLNYIKYRHPRVVTRLIQMLSSKLLGTIQNVPSTPYIDSSYSLRQPIDAPTIVSNLCTVAILPVSNDVPLHAFTMQLCHALNAIDNTLILTKDIIIDKLGPSALDKVNEYRLCAWLGQQEDHHRIVLYQCENLLTPWTRRCMRQADCLLIVGLASNQPNLGQLEKEIENFAIRAQKELVLLHKMDGSRPHNTVNWLNMRNWCSSHHHIRCPDKLLKTGTNEKLIRAFQAELAKEKVNKRTDFSRLARFLTGTSIGLVLGGGGARGAAHIGMIKAMLDANIPIDMIGGTSIGSFVGALWAEENNYDRFCERAREWSFKMTSYKKQILDLTYPVTSMFTGHAFNNAIEDVFGNRQIEDLWIPYFCVTTDISSSKMRIHMNGSLWRYVRSSMSLSGYLPPLCDPIDGHLLLDGGYVNNLPADVMHRMGVNTVLAIDVASKDDDNFYNYGDELSGWWLLWKKWNHWAKPIKVPDLTEIQSRLAYVSCQRGLEMVKNSDYCEYMRPPIDKYRTLQFGSFDEIREVGYNYGKILFDTWIKHGGSIEKFLYRKSKNFTLNNKENPTMNDDSSALERAKKASQYHFEDLSQFVYMNQQSQNLDAINDDDENLNSSITDNEDFISQGFRNYIRMRSADDTVFYDDEEEDDVDDNEEDYSAQDSDHNQDKSTEKNVDLNKTQTNDCRTPNLLINNKSNFKTAINTGKKASIRSSSISDLKKSHESMKFDQSQSSINEYQSPQSVLQTPPSAANVSSMMGSSSTGASNTPLSHAADSLIKIVPILSMMKNVHKTQHPTTTSFIKNKKSI